MSFFTYALSSKEVKSTVGVLTTMVLGVIGRIDLLQVLGLCA